MKHTVKGIYVDRFILIAVQQPRPHAPEKP